MALLHPLCGIDQQDICNKGHTLFNSPDVKVEESEMQNSLATLLIVDDEPSIRQLLSQMLNEIGYRARCAEDGFTALREIRNEAPQLLLSDLRMPGMSGFELLSVVRRRFPAIQTIAMSGSFSGNEVPSGVAADAFYQKGSSLLALMRIIEGLPQIERQTHQLASNEMPLWIHRNSHDYSPGAYVTIACPECLRTFPQTLDTGQQKRKTNCIYCRTLIHYAIVPPADRMPLQVFQNNAAVIPIRQSASISSY
jgi:CheY-like chemotaxis protein